MHVVSTVGSWMLLAGFLTHLFTFIHALLQGKRVGPNPWGGMTLEWLADSPPDEHNFAHEPIVKHGPYAYDTEIPPHWTADEYPLPEEPHKH
jgi:cytochrome c oxidase subunit 1